MPARNTLQVQLFAQYTNPESNNAQRYRQTDRQTDDRMMPIAALPIPDGKDIQTFFRNQNVKIGPNPAYIVRMCRGDCTKILHILCSGMLIKIRFRILGCFPLKV